MTSKKSKTLAEASAPFEPAASDPVFGAIREYKEATAATIKAREALDDGIEAARERGVDLSKAMRVWVEAGNRKFRCRKSEIEVAASPRGYQGILLSPAQRDAYLAELKEMEGKRRDLYIEHGLEPVVLEQERSEERVEASEKHVFSTPAASVAGFAAKVLVFCEQVGFSLTPGDACEEFVNSVEADAKYFAEAGPATPAAALGADAALFALIGEKYVVQFVADHVAGDQVGPEGSGESLRTKLDARAAALETLIAATPARNLIVVMWKLWEMIDCLMSEGEAGDYKTLLAQSALADVESLAGEGAMIGRALAAAPAGGAPGPTST